MQEMVQRDRDTLLKKKYKGSRLQEEKKRYFNKEIRDQCKEKVSVYVQLRCCKIYFRDIFTKRIDLCI